MGPPGSRGISGDVGPEVCTSHFPVFLTLFYNSRIYFAFSDKLSSAYDVLQVTVNYVIML